MNRSGCKNCPVKPCETLYRGSICLSRRHKLGLGDPMTNADRIRAMSDEELAEFLWDFNLADVSTGKMGEFGPHMFRYRLKEWLHQPTEEDDHA